MTVVRCLLWFLLFLLFFTICHVALRTLSILTWWHLRCCLVDNREIILFDAICKTLPELNIAFILWVNHCFFNGSRCVIFEVSWILYRCRIDWAVESTRANKLSHKYLKLVSVFGAIYAWVGLPFFDIGTSYSIFHWRCYRGIKCRQLLSEFFCWHTSQRVSLRDFWYERMVL